MLFFPPFLGGTIGLPGTLAKGLMPFFAFCFASSSTYVLNDIMDRENDAHHPQKKNRPVASGELSPANAYFLCFLLIVLALALAASISKWFLFLLLGYLALSSAYSLKLKHLALVDLFCISAGFILRLQAGGEAFGIRVTEWLFLSVFLLALFLSTGKRLGEKASLGENASCHRKALLAYPDGFLEGTLYMTGGAVLVTYSMYVVSRHGLVYSVFLCCFGLLRFIFRVKSGLGGDPTDSLLNDPALLAVGITWAGMVAVVIYG